MLRVLGDAFRQRILKFKSGVCGFPLPSQNTGPASAGGAVTAEIPCGWVSSGLLPWQRWSPEARVSRPKQTSAEAKSGAWGTQKSPGAAPRLRRWDGGRGGEPRREHRAASRGAAVAALGVGG